MRSAKQVADQSNALLRRLRVVVLACPASGFCPVGSSPFCCTLPSGWHCCRPASYSVDSAGQAALTGDRSEEHTSELQSLMRTSYAVFCLKKKNNISIITT